MPAGSLAGGILMTMHRLSQGGADRVGVLLANGFVAAGIPTRLLLLRGGGEGERAMFDLLHPSVSIGCAGPAMGSRHLELARGLRLIQSEIACRAPAVVLASSNNMGLVTGLSARRQRGRGPRFAMKVTNPVVRPQDKGAARTSYRHRLYRFVFGNYDRILTISEAERITLSAMYPALAGRMETVVNAYILPEMLAEQLPLAKEAHGNIVTLARMMPQKRLDLLLMAFARVTQRGCRLTILGDGPERPALVRLAAALGIADRVDMPGFVTQVEPWLRKADLFVLSSDYEGLPAAMIEALACNVPVVITDCFDGARAMLARADRCHVVPRGDIAGFARAIDASLSDSNTPTNLRAIAAPYEIGASIAAHIAALRPLIAASR